MNRIPASTVASRHRLRLLSSMLIAICLAASLIGHTAGVERIVSSKADNVAFHYADEDAGESGLHECRENEACNVIHNRFWMPALTERLCRCPYGKECPWQWDNRSDKNSSMVLNNRAILQFCNSTVEMDACTRQQDAAIVHGEGDVHNNYLIPRNVTVNCACPVSHYWSLQKYTYEENRVAQIFRCAKKRRCERHDFCGHIRSDLFSAYYRCTCPRRHMCVYKNGTPENVQELLYSGPAFEARCYPY